MELGQHPTEVGTEYQKVPFFALYLRIHQNVLGGKPCYLPACLESISSLPEILGHRFKELSQSYLLLKSKLNEGEQPAPGLAREPLKAATHCPQLLFTLMALVWKLARDRLRK